jgi:hypothetical protein
MWLVLNLLKTKKNKNDSYYFEYSEFFFRESFQRYRKK